MHGQDCVPAGCGGGASAVLCGCGGCCGCRHTRQRGVGAVAVLAEQAERARVAIDPIIPSIVAAGAERRDRPGGLCGGRPDDLPVHPGRRRLRDLLLVRRRHDLVAADLHRLDGPRLPRRPRRARRTSGDIGTLPWYYEPGSSPTATRLSRSGRSRTPSGFLLGERLATLLREPDLELQRDALRGGFKGFEAIAVSRTDDWWRRRPGRSAWMAPVIVTSQNAALFSDKESIWADNAATSPFFGNVYVCNVASGAPRHAVHRSRSSCPLDRRRRHLAVEQISHAANNIQATGRRRSPRLHRPDR